MYSTIVTRNGIVPNRLGYSLLNEGNRGRSGTGERSDGSVLWLRAPKGTCVSQRLSRSLWDNIVSYQLLGYCLYP